MKLSKDIYVDLDTVKISLSDYQTTLLREKMLNNEIIYNDPSKNIFGTLFLDDTSNAAVGFKIDIGLTMKQSGSLISLLEAIWIENPQFAFHSLLYILGMYTYEQIVAENPIEVSTEAKMEPSNEVIEKDYRVLQVLCQNALAEINVTFKKNYIKRFLPETHYLRKRLKEIMK